MLYSEAVPKLQELGTVDLKAGEGKGGGDGGQDEDTQNLDKGSKREIKIDDQGYNGTIENDVGEGSDDENFVLSCVADLQREYREDAMIENVAQFAQVRKAMHQHRMGRGFLGPGYFEKAQEKRHEKLSQPRQQRHPGAQRAGEKTIRIW